MEHTEIRRRLSDYLDNAVSAKEKSEIEAHLAACRSCRGALADLERTIAHMKSLPEVEPPPWLTAKIMARVKAASEPRPALWKRLFLPLSVKLSLEAVALIFLCITGYYLARTTAPQVPLSDTPTMSREEASQSPAVPQPAQQASPRTAVPPAAPAAPSPAFPGAPAVATPPAAESGGYAPPPPAAAPLSPPPAPSPPVYSPPLTGSGPAAKRSKAAAPRADTMNDGASSHSEVMEIQKGAREEMKAFGGVGQRDGTRDRLSSETMERSASPSASPKPWTESSGEGRGAPVDIALRVDDPANAAGRIEAALTGAGGRIVRRTYGETGYLLLARIDGRKIPALVARLERVGVILRQPPAVARDGEMVELRIRW